MHFSTLTGSTIALALASTAYAAKRGYSSNSVSLSDAIGSDVAQAIGSSMGSTGWSWGINSDGSRVQGEQPAQGWLANNINLFNNKISSNPDNVVLTNDPAGSGQVLSVKYGAKSYGLHTNPSGGTSFYSQPFLGSSSARDATSNPFVSATKSNGQGASRNELLLAYSVYFPDDFDFVKGGKLPGLYSSVGEQSGDTLKTTTSGCEGGSEGDIGSKCWSMRVMWRTDGQAEIYAYIPTEVNNLNYKLCPAKETDSKGAKLICNSDYGTSIGRGNFKFEKGKWNDLALHVKLNSAGQADGLIELYHNGQKGINLNDIVIRTDGSQQSNSRRSLDAPARMDTVAKRGSSNNWVDKIMFTTFFGGSGSQWATPHATQTYYKNFALFAGSGQGSNQGSSGSGNSGGAGSSSSSSSASSSPSASHSAHHSHSHSASSSSSQPTSSWSSGSDSGSGSDGSSNGWSSSASASATPSSSSTHHHSDTHHHQASKSQHSDVGQPSSSSSPSSSAFSSSWAQPSATSSKKPKQCRKKSNSSSGQQQRRRTSRAERDAMVQARADAHAHAAQHKRFQHHRSANYMQARDAIWA